MSKTTDWIQTWTGQKVYPLEPDADTIVIEDIAHALSQICRYAGHTERFYSVAEHSVLIAQHLVSPREWKLAALLHDASEAYLGDIPRPLKQLPEFEFYRTAEKRLQAAINEKFGVLSDGVTTAVIKGADREMLSHEALSPNIMVADGWSNMVDLTSHQIRFDPVLPAVAEQMFLDAFERYQASELPVGCDWAEQGEK